MTLNLILLNELMDTLCTLKSYKVDILAEKSDPLRSKALIQCENNRTGEKFFVEVHADYISNNDLLLEDRKPNSNGAWEWGYYFYNEFYEKSHCDYGSFVEMAGAIVQRLKIYG